MTSADFARKYGSKARRDFIAQLPCIICGQGPSQNAHIRTGGMGRKGDYAEIVPLCALHHAQYDGTINGGRAAFFAMYRVDAEWMRRSAERIERLWMSYQASDATR